MSQFGTPPAVLPSRILIVGGEAVGKTTFGRQLAARTGFDLLELDRVIYQARDDPNDPLEGEFEPDYEPRTPMVRRPIPDRIAQLDGWVHRPRWIAEGVSLWWTDQLLDAADSIVWLDHVRLPMVIWRLVARRVRSARREFAMRDGAEKFLRFRDYGRAAGALMSTLWRVSRYALGPAVARKTDDYRAITKRALQAELQLRWDKVLHVQSNEDLVGALDRLAPKPNLPEPWLSAPEAAPIE